MGASLVGSTKAIDAYGGRWRGCQRKSRGSFSRSTCAMPSGTNHGVVTAGAPDCAAIVAGYCQPTTR
jgi:hypothetical protein